ncbi:hypothetical protein N7486_005538 [Penicillium sp. IBT 16267x]|nr:hypothetical protein N7486_005538 [Penicillium sp. IBT 16267x]
MVLLEEKPWGYRWRSSTPFVLVCIAISQFAETFLYGFVVPILPYILQTRNHVDFSDVQRLTYLILTTYGAVSIIASVFIGQLADRAGSRKMPLVLSLALTFAGTLFLAASTNLAGIFIGRILQSIGGTAAWIVGLATLRDSSSGDKIGRSFGMVRSCMSMGALSGPAIGGILLELTGYWITWGSVLFVLFVDIMMRLMMLDQPKEKSASMTDDDTAASSSAQSDGTSEHSALLPDSSSSSYDSTDRRRKETTQTKPTASFYKIVLLHPRVIVGIMCSLAYSAIIASYATTIPTHVKVAFDWGSGPAGLLFVALQAPIMVASPIYGWVRDKVGTKIPASIGFFLMGPLIWFVGAADQEQFPWGQSLKTAKATYIAAMIAIGFTTNLMSNVATIEITCVVDDFEAKQPGILGRNGGYSHTYSLATMIYSLGLLIGTLLSGSLTNAVGYYYMNCILAGICIIMSFLSFTCLGGKSTLKRSSSEQESED